MALLLMHVGPTAHQHQHKLRKSFLSRMPHGVVAEWGRKCTSKNKHRSIFPRLKGSLCFNIELSIIDEDIFSMFNVKGLNPKHVPYHILLKRGNLKFNTFILPFGIRSKQAFKGSMVSLTYFSHENEMAFAFFWDADVTNFLRLNL